MDSSSAFEVRRVSGEREAGDRERFHATEPKAVSSSAASTERCPNPHAMDASLMISCIMLIFWDLTTIVSQLLSTLCWHPGCFCKSCISGHEHEFTYDDMHTAGVSAVLGAHALR